MINLLPDDSKRDLRAARTNVLLLRYNFLTITSAGGLLLICLLFFFILSANQSNAVSKSTENQVKASSYDTTRVAATEYQTNLATAKTILGNSVNYTSTIFEIAKLLPTGVVLDGISLKAGDFGKQTSFTASAKSYAQATQLKQNFQNSKLFENVYFQSINNDDASGSTNPGYPVQVILSAQLKKATVQ